MIHRALQNCRLEDEQMETRKHCKKELDIEKIITSYYNNGKWVGTKLCPYCKLPLQK